MNLRPWNYLCHACLVGGCPVHQGIRTPEPPLDAARYEAPDTVPSTEIVNMWDVVAHPDPIGDIINFREMLYRRDSYRGGYE